jgi:zinc transporter 7
MGVSVSTTALLAALSSTALISLAPNLILFAFPQFGKNDNAKGNAILVMGQALAAGGLLGDVFLHTLSHATTTTTTRYEEEEEDHVVGLWILLGFGIFLTVDMILRSRGGGPGAGHSHSHNNNNNNNEHEHEESKKDILILTPTILLNLAADALHNFTDGLAIGASYASSYYTVSHANDETVTFASLLASRGGLATISIMFHEIPHELGDYCILLKGGFTKPQAIMAQFVTAIAAMIGTVVGLLWGAGAGEGGGCSQSVIYLTAGGFVYLASVNILPQVLEEHVGFRVRMAQLCAFGVGVAFMYGVLLLEDHDHSSCGQHDHAHHDHYESHTQHDHYETHDNHHEHAGHNYEL